MKSISNITGYPAPETLSSDKFEPILSKLRILLDNLPDVLPSYGNKSEKFAVFLTQPDEFVLDPDLMEKKECEVATLSKKLKAVNSAVLHDTISKEESVQTPQPVNRQSR